MHFYSFNCCKEGLGGVLGRLFVRTILHAYNQRYSRAHKLRGAGLVLSARPACVYLFAYVHGGECAHSRRYVCGARQWVLELVRVSIAKVTSM